MLKHHTLMQLLEIVVLKVDVTKIENLQRREVNPEIRMIVNPKYQKAEKKKEMMIMGATSHHVKFLNLKSTAERKVQCVISLIKSQRNLSLRSKMTQQFHRTTL